MAEFSETPILQEQQSKSSLTESAPPTEKSVDLLIVLGHGPVKPLLLDSDLDDDMRQRWGSFKTDPLHNTEPDFRVLEGDAYLSQLEGLSETEVQEKMAQWQKTGRFGLNRWGRENGLSAGFALLSGYTDRVLLTGGKTIPSWAKETLTSERQEQWPSEAELMADIIKRRFGRIYQRKYGKSIDSAIIFEDKSTNTLENFANSINSDEGEEILHRMKKTGVLTSSFHVPRAEELAYLFAPVGNLQKGSSSQQILGQRAETKNKRTYGKILTWMTDPNNTDYRAKGTMEQIYHGALKDPQLLTYWLGYVGIVEDPLVLQKTVQRLNSDADYRPKAVEAFNQAGLDFLGLTSVDLTRMDPDEFKAVANKLKILTTKEYRAMPEIPK